MKLVSSMSGLKVIIMFIPRRHNKTKVVEELRRKAMDWHFQGGQDSLFSHGKSDRDDKLATRNS